MNVETLKNISAAITPFLSLILVALAVIHLVLKGISTGRHERGKRLFTRTAPLTAREQKRAWEDYAKLNRKIQTHQEKVKNLSKLLEDYPKDKLKA